MDFRMGMRPRHFVASSAGWSPSTSRPASSGPSPRIPPIWRWPGIGYTWEHDLHIHLERAKLNEHLAGCGAWHRARVATHLLDRASELPPAAKYE